MLDEVFLTVMEPVRVTAVRAFSEIQPPAQHALFRTSRIEHSTGKSGSVACAVRWVVDAVVNRRASVAEPSVRSRPDREAARCD